MPTETEKLPVRISAADAAKRTPTQQPSPPLESHPAAMDAITEAYSNSGGYPDDANDEDMQPSGS